MNAFAHNIFAAWHSIISHGPKWIVRGYILLVAGVSKRFFSGLLATRCRNVVLEAEWPKVGLPAQAVRFGGHPLKLTPHLGEFDIDALWFRALPYESGLAAWIGTHAADAYDVVIEIGANVGVYSCLFGALANRKSRLKRVYVFEPARQAFERLQGNLKSNASDRVTAFQAAVAQQSGFVEFYLPQDHLTNGSLKRDFAAYFSDDVATDTVFAVGADSLKKLVHDGERVLLKIDVEGYEAELLESLIAFVDVHNADLIVEVLTGAEVAISSWALTHGYSTAMIMGDGHMVSGPVTAHAVHRDWLLQRESKPDARPSIA